MGEGGKDTVCGGPTTTTTTTIKRQERRANKKEWSKREEVHGYTGVTLPSSRYMTLDICIDCLR